MTTETELRTAHENASSMRELQTLLGYSVSGPTSNMLKRKLAELGLDVPVGVKKGKKQALDDILVLDSTYLSSKSLRVRLVKEGLLTEECVMCHTGPEWLGLPLTLQLDHINGVHSDNRLENLRLLCPNCHTQTETWGGKLRYAPVG